MERLTPNPETAYPVERRIMDENKEGEVRPNNRSDKRSEPDRERKESERGEARGKANLGDGIFSNFNPEQFKQNRSLEELAQMVKAAGRKNEVNEAFLQDINQQLFRRVQLGLVSDNESVAFGRALNAAVVQASEKGRYGKGPDKDVENLAREVREIIEKRRRQGITSDDVESIKAILEKTYGRELTPLELQRAMFGIKSLDKSPQNREFEAQVSLIENIVKSPKRIEDFMHSINSMSNDELKSAMSGMNGKVALEILMGDIADGRDDYHERLAKLLGGDTRHLKEGLKFLARDIEKQQESETPKTDRARVEAAKKQAQEFINDARKRREVTAEEVDRIMSFAEKGRPVLAGGADEAEMTFDAFIENIREIPEDNEELFKRIRDANKENDIVQLMLTRAYPDSLTRAEELERWQRLSELEDPVVYKQRAREFLSNLKNKARQVQEELSRKDEGAEIEEEGRTIRKRGGGSWERPDWIKDPNFFREEPKNIQELAMWIATSDDRATWGPEGPYPLFNVVREVNPETGREEPRIEKFNEENFIRWLRNKILEHHSDNPNDPMSPLTSVAIQTLYRPVNLLEMKYNKQRYFSDPATGKILDNMYNEIINEAWLFGVRRNNDLAYKQIMTNDTKLFEVLVEMNAKNDHTSSTNLVDLLKMADDFKKDSEDTADNRVGDALLAMNQIYRNISDKEKLRKILPEDSPLFSAEGFKNAARILLKKGFDEDVTEFGSLRFDGNRIYSVDPRTKVRTEIFDESGKLVSDDRLIGFLNFFPEATPNETNELFVRELVKQSAAKLVGFDTGADRKEYEKFQAKHGEMKIDEYRKLSRINLDWAEVNSWVEQRWNGAAARNDTRYRGYDAWTKMYMQYYRERQSGPGTAGPIGNPEDMQIFRMLSPDMWLAIRTESGEAVQEIFDDLHQANIELYRYPEGSEQRNEIQRRKDKLYAKLRFPRFTQSDWAANGIKRQSEVWHNVLNTEDINFSEIVKRDNWGQLKFDRAKFEEVVKDDFLKKRRYAFSSNSAINYGAITRIRERDKLTIGKDGRVEETFKYKDKYLAEAMFGEVVIGSIRADWYDGELSYVYADENGESVTRRAPKKGEEFDPEKHGTLQGYLNSQGARERILKNVCRAGLAAQLRAHRKFGSLDERWDNHAVRKFYAALRSMPQYIEDPATGKEVEIPNSQFFSEEDIEWIRKHSGTTKGRLIAEDLALISGDAFIGAFPGAFKAFWDDITSDIAA